MGKQKKNIGTKKLTTVCPGWIAYDAKQQAFLLIPEKADVVRTIFKMCSETCGLLGVVRFLNETNVPVFGRGEIWHRSYVNKIIRNRAVLGEFQPGTRNNGVQLPIGDPVKNYYPAVVTEDVFIAAHAAIERRNKNTRGPKGSEFQNILSGLAFCKSCGAKMMYRNRGDSSKGGKKLCCSNQFIGLSCKMPEWDFEQTVETILKHLHELDFRSLDTNKASPTRNIESQLAALEFQIKVFDLRASTLTDRLIEPTLNNATKSDLIEKLNKLQKEKQDAIKKFDELKTIGSELYETDRIFRSTALKNLITKLNDNSSDFYLRSSINELLRKAISKIEFEEIAFVFYPWEYGEDSKEVKTYRKSAKKRETMKLDALVLRPSFKEHCRKFTRRLSIQYKIGPARYIDYGTGISSRQPVFEKRPELYEVIELTIDQASIEQPAIDLLSSPDIETA